MGRGKLEIKKIHNAASRQVTFSKRRKGLLKKAQELSILCDAEIGLIIFSNTGRLYEFASSSLKSVIDRYEEIKGENQTMTNAEAEAKYWQREAANLKLQLEHLQERHRRIMGQDLSGLNVKDLHSLERTLESSQRSVRTQKDKLVAEEIKELHQKVILSKQENIEIQQKIKLVEQENSELKRKVQEKKLEIQTDQSSSSTASQDVTNENTAIVPFHLQLSQPFQETNVSPESTLTLRYNFPIMWRESDTDSYGYMTRD